MGADIKHHRIITGLLPPYIRFYYNPYLKDREILKIGAMSELAFQETGGKPYAASWDWEPLPPETSTPMPAQLHWVYERLLGWPGMPDRVPPGDLSVREATVKP